ncbi:lytic transglycosylase domain-containing protein, partial [Amycolatopsis magusensis]
MTQNLDGARGLWARALQVATVAVLFAGVGFAAGPGSRPATVDTPPPPATVLPGPVATPPPDGAIGADGDTVVTSAGTVVQAGHTAAPAPSAGGAVAGVPGPVLAAYQQAVAALTREQPGCRLPLVLLAAIGKVESGHARGGQLDPAGTTTSPILGPVLSGGGFAAIRDTDGGRWDGNAQWDRAVGPMQFIPGTWVRWGSDGNGDRDASPHNILDATLAAGRYLCAGGRDLATPEGLRAGILSYNRSVAYLNLVLNWMRTYAAGIGPSSTSAPGAALAAPAPPVAPAPVPPVAPAPPAAPPVPPGPA